MMSLLRIACVALISGGVSGYNISTDHDVMMYLNRFGYVNDKDMSMTYSSHEDMSIVKPMLMEFQKMCNIKQTGELDGKTMEMMNAPRCGNLDVNLTESHTMFMTEMEKENEVLGDRYRRFAINEQNYKWKKRELSYKMGMFSQNMESHVTKDVALEQLHKAFEMWAEVTNLDFIHAPTKKKVDIEVSFTTRFHMQDMFPFDGPGKTLAHAFPPGPGVLGDVHFEDEENWTVNSPKGTNVLFVAVHEIGHALGLVHSGVKGAIMQPFYPGYIPRLQLHSDDIAGIQSMYGRREGRAPTTTQAEKKQDKVEAPTTTRVQAPLPEPTRATTTTPRPFRPGVTFERPELCKDEDASIDAITALKDGSVYVFKKNYVFQIDGKGNGILPGWPHRIEAIFKGLEGNLDAAVTRKNGKTYFFKGAYYWRFDGLKMDAGYPKKISVHFRGIPDNVDSAFEWVGGIYFMKGNKIWRFDPSTRPFVSDKYPIPLDRWELGKNIPRIDASFKAPSGHIYFFYKGVYFRFDEKNFRVHNDMNPPYPRSSKVMWFGCVANKPPTDYRDIRNSAYETGYNDAPPSNLDYY